MNTKRTLLTIIAAVICASLFAQSFTKEFQNIEKAAWGKIANCDFEKDGDMDFFLCGRNGSNKAVAKLYVNNQGGFTALNQSFEGAMLATAIWGDWNNDGYSDLIYSGKDNNNETVLFLFENKNGRSFTQITNNLPAISSGSIASADFNNDGKPDLIITGRNVNDEAIAKVLYNKGDFKFEESTANFKGVYFSDVKCADFDQDGFSDIIFAGDAGFSRTTKVYKNINGESFKEINSQIVNVGSSAIDCADYDLDNDMDVLLTGLDVYGNEVTKIYRNDGGFIFTDVLEDNELAKLPSLAYGDVNWTDFDKDGDLDIALCGKSNQILSAIYLNEGNNFFRKSSDEFIAVYHGDIGVADYNNNGFPDALVLGLDQDKNLVAQIYFNTGKWKQKIAAVAKKIAPTFKATTEIVGTETTFINESSTTLDKPLTYKWNFGDGNTSEEESPKHKYEKVGSYTVVLTATSGDEFETISKVVSVKPQMKLSSSFTDKELIKIHTEAINILNEYADKTNAIGETSQQDEKALESLKEGLIGLFLNRNIVVKNDLNPSEDKLKMKEIETYASDLILYYPDGIAVSIDMENAKVSNVVPHKKNLYTVDILATKSINGNFMNKNYNNTVSELNFRIAFAKENNRFEKFKIVGIRDPYAQQGQDQVALEEINKVEISIQETEHAHEFSKALLHDYIRNLSLLADPNEYPEDKEIYKEAFLNLFADQEGSLYNDLEPSPDQQTIKVSEYLDLYMEHYANGVNNISLNVDSADYKPVLMDEEGYYLYAYADKNFSADHKGKKHSSAENLIFKITFNRNDNVFHDFKIASVNQSALNFYATRDALSAATPSYRLKNIKRNGWSVGGGLSIGNGTIFNQNISNITLSQNNHEWNYASEMAFKINAEAYYFRNNNIGLKTGISYAQLETRYNTQGAYTEAKFSNDLNNDPYNKMINIKYDSILNASVVSIPVFFEFISSKPRNTGFYIDLGFQIDYLLSFESSVIGNKQLYGYYPENPEQLKYLYIEELGFYDEPEIDRKFTLEKNPLNFSAAISGGVVIPFQYFSTIKIGSEIVYGLSDISKNEKYIDIFGNSIDKKSTTLNYMGIRISMMYKL